MRIFLRNIQILKKSIGFNWIRHKKIYINIIYIRLRLSTLSWSYVRRLHMYCVYVYMCIKIYILYFRICITRVSQLRMVNFLPWTGQKRKDCVPTKFFLRPYACMNMNIVARKRYFQTNNATREAYVFYLIFLFLIIIRLPNSSALLSWNVLHSNVRENRSFYHFFFFLFLRWFLRLIQWMQKIFAHTLIFRSFK